MQPNEMRAHAELGTEALWEPAGLLGSGISVLRSQPPLSLRVTNAKEPHAWADCLPAPARVSLAAGSAGPVGGDQVSLDIDVGPCSALVLTDISATVVLPGPHGRCSRITTSVHVGDGGTFVWLPDPFIAAAKCNHINDVRIALAPTARLLMREELILGRHSEKPGAISQRLQIRRGGNSLYCQELKIGPGAPGWDSAAVAATSRAVGSLIVVDPQRDWTVVPSSLLGDTAALLPLAGPAVLITALAEDNLEVRKALNTGLSELGTPWQTHDVTTEEEACDA